MTFKLDTRTILSNDERYIEKRELVFQEFERCLDLDLVMEIVPLSAEHIKRLLVDEELHARISVCMARFKGGLIEKFSDFADSTNEGIAKSAIFSLGEMFYPKRFKANQLGSSERPMHVIWDEVEPSDEPS